MSITFSKNQNAIIKNLFENSYDFENQEHIKEIQIKMIKLFEFKEQITKEHLGKKYKALSLKIHPDKVRDSEEKKKKAEKLYPILNSLKNKIEELIKKESLNYTKAEILLNQINANDFQEKRLKNLDDEHKALLEKQKKTANTEFQNNNNIFIKLKNEFNKSTLDSDLKNFLIKNTFNNFVNIYNEFSKLLALSNLLNKEDIRLEDTEFENALYNSIKNLGFNTDFIKDQTSKISQIQNILYHIYVFRENLIKFQMYVKFFEFQQNFIFHKKIFTFSEDKLEDEIKKFDFLYTIDDSKKSLYIAEIKKIHEKTKWFKNFTAFKARFNKAENKINAKNKTKKIENIVNNEFINNLIVNFWAIIIGCFLLLIFFKFAIINILKFFTFIETHKKYNFIKKTIKILKKILEKFNKSSEKVLELMIITICAFSIISLLITLLIICIFLIIEILSFVSFLINFFFMKEEIYQEELLEHKSNLLKEFCQKESIEIKPEIKNVIENEDFLLQILFCDMNNEEEFNKIIDDSMGSIDPASKEKIKNFFISIKENTNESYKNSFTEEGINERNDAQYKNSFLFFNLTDVSHEINRIIKNKQCKNNFTEKEVNKRNDIKMIKYLPNKD